MSTDPSLVPPGTMPTTFIPTSSAGNVSYMVMSYPGRPQMVPGLPVPPGMGMPYMQLGGPPPMVPGVMSMTPYNVGVRLPTLASSAPTVRPASTYRPPVMNKPAPARDPPVDVPDGPPVTVFVGNIADKAPDQMIRFILAACGHVSSWKRVQGFGFCEFGNPDAGLRAVRLLHDFEVGIKKLVVRVDAKTQTVLDEYKNEKRKKKQSGSPLQDEAQDEDDYMDDDMKNADKNALERISQILQDFDSDLKAAISSAKEEAKMAAEKIKSEPKDTPPSVDLTDVHIEEERRDLITREIGKFREIMKGE